MNMYENYPISISIDIVNRWTDLHLELINLLPTFSFFFAGLNTCWKLVDESRTVHDWSTDLSSNCSLIHLEMCPDYCCSIIMVKPMKLPIWLTVFSSFFSLSNPSSTWMKFNSSRLWFSFWSTCIDRVNSSLPRIQTNIWFSQL